MSCWKTCCQAILDASLTENVNALVKLRCQNPCYRPKEGQRKIWIFALFCLWFAWPVLLGNFGRTLLGFFFNLNQLKAGCWHVFNCTVHSLPWRAGDLDLIIFFDLSSQNAIFFLFFIFYFFYLFIFIFIYIERVWERERER